MNNLIKTILFALLYASIALSEAQTYPVQNLQVRGTAQFMGASTFQSTTNIACVSINTYGADPTGVAFSDAAVTSAIAANTLPNICISALPGTYKFANAITVNFPNSIASVTINGSGEGATEFYWPTNANGIVFNGTSQLNSFHIADLTLTTGSAPATGNAVTLNQTGTLAASNNATEQSSFTNVDIRGHDAPNQTDYWSVGVDINCWSVINFVNFKIDGPTNASGYTTVGVGVAIQGNVSTGVYAVQYNFMNTNITCVGVGILYGTMVQGVQIVTSNITGGNVGVQSNSGETGLAQLTFNNSQCNVLLYCIFTSTPIGNMAVIGSAFFCPKTSCISIYMPDSLGAQIVGNSFLGAGTVSGQTAIIAIRISGNSNNFPIAISGNFIKDFTGSGSAGVYFISTSKLITMTGNVYANNTTNAVNTGTNNFIDGVYPSVQSVGIISPTYPIGIKGNQQGINVTAGSIGEYLFADSGAVPLTSAINANVVTLSLTAGDWDVSATGQVNPAGTTTMTQFQAGISTVASTLPSYTSGGSVFFETNNAGIWTGQAQVFPIGTTRVNVSVTTPVYCVMQASFAVSTATAFCHLQARRR